MNYPSVVFQIIIDTAIDTGVQRCRYVKKRIVSFEQANARVVGNVLLVLVCEKYNN